MRILRINEVCKKTGIGRSTIYRMMQHGEFPKPIKLGKKISGWLEEDIDQWLREQAELSKAS